MDGAVIRGEARVLAEVLDRRRSCRAYLPEPVPHETIEELLRMAQRSASWCNTQPWRLIVTEGDATDRFRAALYGDALHSSFADSDFPMPQEYTGVAQSRRRESGWQLYAALGIERGDRAAAHDQTMENFELFGAPHVAIVTVDASLGLYGAVDAGVYIGSFLAAAQALGLGAVAQGAIASRSSFVRDYFLIPDDERVLVGISFGYADENHPANSYRTSRAGLDAAVRWVRD